MQPDLRREPARQKCSCGILNDERVDPTREHTAQDSLEGLEFALEHQRVQREVQSRARRVAASHQLWKSFQTESRGPCARMEAIGQTEVDSVCTARERGQKRLFGPSGSEDLRARRPGRGHLPWLV